MSQIKLILPTSWDEVSIKKYIKLTKINKDLPPITIVIEILHILTDVDRVTLGTIDPSELSTIDKELAWIATQPSIENVVTEFKIDKEVYKYQREFHKMTLAEMVSFETLVENTPNSLEQLPYLLAIILRKEKDGKLEDFDGEDIYGRIDSFENELTIGQTSGLFFFFKNGGNSPMMLLEVSLQNLRKLRDEIMKN